MARFLGKTEKNQEIFAYDMKESDVKQVGDNEIEIIGSTEDIDRDGEILKMDGWDLKNYKKNPVVLAAHAYHEPAIGRAVVRVEGGKLMFKIEFPPEGVNPIADIYKGLYKNGFMRASSVGFMPVEWKWGEEPGQPRRTFLKQELLEISLVSVPANPAAVLTEKSIVQAVKAGKLKASDLKTIEDFIKRAFNAEPEKKKFFLLPNIEVKSDEPEKCEKCGFNIAETIDGKKFCGCKKSEDAKGQEAQSNPDAEANEKLLKEIEPIVSKMFDERLKAFKEDLLKEIHELMGVKSHYINDLLKDQGSDDPIDSSKQVEEVSKALTESFRFGR